MAEDSSSGTYSKTIEFKGNRRFLSNFMESKIVMGELTFPTAMHAFQAAKSTDPKDWKKIQKTPSPLAALVMGRKLPLRDDWREIKLAVMAEVVRCKFDQNPELKAPLLATGTEELVNENLVNDKFWGIQKTEGENHLGKILMAYRAQG